MERPLGGGAPRLVPLALQMARHLRWLAPRITCVQDLECITLVGDWLPGCCRCLALGCCSWLAFPDQLSATVSTRCPHMQNTYMPCTTSPSRAEFVRLQLFCTLQHKEMLQLICSIEHRNTGQSIISIVVHVRAMCAYVIHCTPLPSGKVGHASS